MRHCSRLAAAGLLFLIPAPVGASDGALGPQSSGSVTIRVSVAPRVWRAASDTLCVAAAPGSFSLRTETSGAMSLIPASMPCSSRAQAVTLAPEVVNGTTTLLVVPE